MSNSPSPLYPIKDLRFHYLLGNQKKNTQRRFKIGFVFQTFQLFPVMTAEENVEYFLSRPGVESGLRQQRVREALESISINLL